VTGGDLAQQQPQVPEACLAVLDQIAMEGRGGKEDDECVVEARGRREGGRKKPFTCA
jgi:hypothetical protein